MKYLIFDYNSNGHHLEYLNHIMRYVSNINNDDEFVFLLSPDFKSKWEYIDITNESQRCKVIYLLNKENDMIFDCNQFVRSYILSRILSKYYKQVRPDKVILLDLVSYLPFLVLAIQVPRIRCVNAIMYKIPRYRPQKKLITRIFDWIMLKLIIKSKTYNSVFLLNDEDSPAWYNNKFKTNVFKFLPDPINIADTNISQSVHHSDNKIVLLQGGGIGKRKGTFKLMEALRLLTPMEKQCYQLRLIGNVNDVAEKNKLLNLINECKDAVDIFFSNEFVSFKTFLKEIQESDYILIPYENWEQSSGLLGYAAYFQKPVIGPQKGLLGKLITNYNLGITVDQLDAETLKTCILNLHKKDVINSKYSEYVNSHTIEKFVTKLFQ